ncbi:hypothetical protein AN958_11805 [Leucoagaricus sp. SymC.cos]|nr:hypothetical protein AN958_11805 [Leucoagaricus sp. SymC.cos]
MNAANQRELREVLPCPCPCTVTLRPSVRPSVVEVGLSSLSHTSPLVGKCLGTGPTGTTRGTACQVSWTLIRHPEGRDIGAKDSVRFPQKHLYAQAKTLHAERGQNDHCSPSRIGVAVTGKFMMPSPTRTLESRETPLFEP